jgi:hypothetical protein
MTQHYDYVNNVHLYHQDEDECKFCKEIVKKQVADNTNEVWVSVGVTKNLGNFESMRIDAGARRIVQDGEVRDSVYEKLWKEVQDQIEDQLKPVNAFIASKGK